MKSIVHLCDSIAAKEVITVQFVRVSSNSSIADAVRVCYRCRKFITRWWTEAIRSEAVDTVLRRGMSYEKHWLGVSTIDKKWTREKKKKIWMCTRGCKTYKRYKLLLICCGTDERWRNRGRERRKKKWQFHRSHGRSYEGALLVWNRVCDDKCFCMMTCAIDRWAPANISEGTPHTSPYIACCDEWSRAEQCATDRLVAAINKFQWN